MKTWLHQWQRTYDGRVYLYFGGTTQCLAGELELVPPGAIVIVFDVPGETQKVEVRQVKGRTLHIVSLGKGVSLRQLAKTMPKDVWRALTKLPSFNLALGGGQNRTIGLLMARAWLRSREFDTFMSNVLIPTVRRAGGGKLANILLFGVAGMCGAVGSGISQAILQAIAGRLAATGATVDVCFLGIGQIAYTGLGPNVERNGAVAHAESVRIAGLPAEENNLHKAYYTLELRPSKLQDTRNLHVREALQGIISTEFSNAQFADRPNDCRASRFGNITSLQFNRFQGLPDAQVVADGARPYAQQIADVLQSHPDPTLWVSGEIALNQRPAPRIALEQLTAVADRTEWARYAAAIEQPGAHYHPNLLLTAKDGRVVNLSGGTGFSGNSDTLTEAGERLVALLSTADWLTREIEEVRQQREDADVALKEAQRRTRELHETVQAPRFYHRAFSAEYWLSKLEASARQQRNAADAARILKIQHDVLCRTLDVVQMAVEAMIARLANLQALLNRHANDANQRTGEPSVLPVAIDERFAELLAAADEGADQKLLTALRRSVGQVTLQGLKQIVGAKSTALDDILDAIYRGLNVELGPPLGGIPTDEVNREYLILPPMSALDSGLLRARHGQRQDDAVNMVFADCATASVNVISLEYHAAQSLLELFPHSYRKGLVDTLKSPLPEMILPDPSILDDLHFVWDGVELTLVDESADDSLDEPSRSDESKPETLNGDQEQDGNNTQDGGNNS